MASALIGLVVLGVIGYVIFAGVNRGVQSARRESLDGGDIAKSAAIAIGMFLAMLAVTVGLVDLLQAFVAGERLAGTNSDLARGVSLLIVGAPTFGFLALMTDRQSQKRRSAGITDAPRGWSIHLVAALAVTLTGVLVSIGQVIEDITTVSRSVESTELAQLVGWLAVWLTYWFGLRPRFGVRGNVHLAVGTLFGLVWLVAGTIGFFASVFTRAYHRLFDPSLAESGQLLSAVLAALVGLVVWVWHWRLLNKAGSQGTIEKDARHSLSWYGSVVAFSIGPAILTLVTAVAAAVSGTLIWFLGSTDGSSAAEWFEPAPTIIVVTLVALAVWAYHRWELLRDGPPERNEPLRFHDYGVAAIGLIGAVIGTAGIMTVFFSSLGNQSLVAHNFGIDNWLIGSTVVLVTSAGLWWYRWQRIETHWLAEPIPERSSLWRKLYLAIGAGVGGLTGAGALIYLLFEFLDDLFNGTLGSETIQDSSAAISWVLAIAALVWFHIDVWRKDRDIPKLAMHAGPDPAGPPPAPTGPPIVAGSPPLAPAGPPLAPAGPPLAPAGPPVVAGSPYVVPEGRPPVPSPAVATSPSTTALPVAATNAAAQPSILKWATPNDFGELFTLQRAAFVDEAVTYGTADVPSLSETFDDFSHRIAQLPTMMLVDGRRIVGAVSVRTNDQGEPWLERLMVAPDRRNEQLGRQLVQRMHNHVSEQGHASLFALVGDRDPKLETFYASLGFATLGRTEAGGGVPELLIMGRTEPASSPNLPA